MREENARRGYEEVKTPVITDVNLWRQSGHWDKYRDNMYFIEIDGRQFGLKPMNCPDHIQIYKADRRSYRDLPCATPRPGSCTATSPAASCTASCACARSPRTTPTSSAPRSRSRRRCCGCLDLGFAALRALSACSRGSSCRRGPSSAWARDASWDHAETALANAMRRQGLEFEIGEGEGTFYGPKIDVHMTDSIGRSWQLGTVQLDYLMPERFELSVHRRRQRAPPPGDDPSRDARLLRALHRHPDRALRGRISGVAGAGAGDRAADRRAPQRLRASRCARACARRGCAVDVDERDEKVGRKIRDAELRKIPYLLVVGDREAEADGSRSARVTAGRRGRRAIAIDAFADRLSPESYDSAPPLYSSRQRFRARPLDAYRHAS